MWEDLDADGIQDAGEPGIEGVTVMLLDGDGNMLDQTTTDATGFYEFTDLTPGDYIVKFTAPAGFDPSPANEGGDDTVDSDADETTGETGVITLESGESDPTNDAGFYQPASLGDFVWEDLDADGIQDAGEPGIEGVTVMLLDGDGNMLDQTTTDATGFYEFTDLIPGDYIVKFTAPGGFDPSPANQGGDDTVDSDADETTGETGVITLESGENDPTNDAGFYQPASLGDFVWEDLDADGIQDAGEPGIEGVTVMLLDGDGNMLDQTTTDATGFYEFTDLVPGDYIVKFTAPGGFDPSPANQGGDDTEDSDADETTGETGVITLESGENDDTNDAGFYEPASLGDFVWLDEDADGIQDAGEPGIEGVTVMLLDGDGNMLDQTTTDATGFYEFTDLVPGDYIVKFTAPAGLNPSPANEGGDDTVDSDADETTGESPVVNLESGENDPTIDAGFFGNASLGDFVWEDLDADGIQDAGEPGIEGVTVMLLDGDGNMLDQTTTDANGFYEFTDLTPGDYIVKFTAPAGFDPSPANQGGDDTVDSDADETTGETGVITLESGDNDPTNDAGFYQPASLGDFVWEDLDADGIQDAGEPGIEGVTVMLLDGDGNMLDQTTTDANGFYEFTDLVPGDYIVKFTAPGGFDPSPANQGGDDAEDSDADETTGETGVITLESGENDDTNDAGFYEPASLGDFVWEDLDGDGEQDPNEPGVEDVTVNLKDETGTVIASTTTDANGFYEFTDLVPGEYSVQFVLPGGFVYTDLNATGNEATDSDADPAMDGMTDPVVLESGENNDDLDGGIVREPELELVKNLVEVESLGDEQFAVTYEVIVSNAGGATEYDLRDTPAFDDDITIDGASYTSDAPGNAGGALAGSGPWTLADDQFITSFGEHTYIITVNVTRDLLTNNNDNGDNEYTPCAVPGNGPGSQPGQGLYNLAELDEDNDGQFDLEDDACGDLPNLDMEKDFVSATANGDGTYTVQYTVTVTNDGGADGTYSLTDTPQFDDDITINGGSFSGQNSGALTNGTNTLATNESIAAGATHTYNLSFNVTLDLSSSSTDGGDNQYTACSEPGNGPGSNPGEGLYNLAELDTDGDGDTDIEDDACGDLPNITMEKDFVSATPNGDGTYTVTYTITVGNNGGAAGEYGLTDTPSFDDDVTINSGSFSGQNAGALTDGTNTLATNEAIAAGATHTYNLSFNVTLNLTGDANDTDGGDNIYTACSEPGNGPGSNPGEGLYNLAELDSDGDGDTDIEDDACGDLPNITLVKDLTSVEVQPDGSYRVLYTVTVQNTGGADGEYRLLDSPLFDDDITINAWDYTFQDVDAGIGNGPAFVGAPPVPIDFGLRTITAGNTHIYTIGFDVTLDLTGTDPDGGDDIYTACSEPGNGPGSNPGEGLYNLAEVDTDNDGDTDLEDDACGDLPNLTMVKDFGSVSANGDGTYTVTYNVIVSNTGGAEGTYTLYDTPQFDDDVTINGGSFSGQNAGALTDGQNTLATAETIAAGDSHTYNLSFNVTLDLSGDANDNDGGDNQYTACSEPGNGPGSNPGEGLYNLAELDVDNDGDIDIEDDACGDLPNLLLEKDFVSATPNGDGTYTVLYTVTVENNGGAEGIYSLQDTPSFDDDVVINSGSFSGQNSGALNTSGSTTLTTGETIAAGATHTYNLSFNVSLSINMNSTDGGDNVYTACGESNSNGVPVPGEGLYNLAELDEDNDGDFDQEDDACGDLPLYDLALTKDVTSAGPYTQGSTVTYAVVVTNEGEIDATNVEVTDTPDAGLNFVTSDADGVQVTDLGGGVFSIASLPIGQSQTINLTFTIDPTFQGSSLLNKAEITEDDPYDDVDSDPETSDDVDEDGDGDGDDDDEDEVEIPVEQTYDLALTKDLLSAGPFSQGSNVTFTISVTNEGSLDAANVEVTDRPDADFSFVGANVPANVIDNNDGTFVILDLDQGETESWEVTYQIDPNFQGTTLVNEAEITEDDGDDEDSTPDNDDPTEDDQDDEEVPVEQVFDLALRKTVLSAGPFEQGSTVMYQIEVINQGSLDATDVEVTDYIPSGMTLADAAWSPSGSLATRTIAGPIAANGGTATFTITLQVDATFQGTSLTNFAEISDAENALGQADVDSDSNQNNTDDAGGQPNSPADDAVNGDGTGTPGDGVAATDEDDHDPANIAVNQVYDLALTKDLVSAGPFQQGSNVTFTISVTNEGSLDAANVEVTDRPDAGFNFVGANVPANVIDNNDGTFVILDLDQGETETWEVTYMIDPGFQGFVLVNEAEITEDDGDDEDSTPDNDDPTEDDQDDEEVPVEQSASIDIEKATNGQDADNAPGVIIIVPNTPPQVTWTYVVTNTGTLDLVDVTVTDDQEGLVGVIPFLAAGDSETLTLTGTAMRGQYSNLATVVGTPVDEDGNENPNGIDDVTDEDPSNYNGVFINVEKQGDRTEICAGEEVTFTLTVRLLGGTEGVQLRDINVADSNLPNDLMPYDAFFVASSDLNGNGFIDFIDNNNDGISDEEFVWTYTIAYDETTTNFAEDMAEVWFVDPNTNDEFFIGTAMNMDDWTVTVNQDLCASLGDYVWEDLDGDGIQDPNEPGVEGVTVNLKDENGNIIDTQTTDADGEYLFTELTPGTYSVQFELPTGFTFTDLNAGGDDTVDSDADPAMNGMTDPVTLGNGDDNRDQDAGIVRDPDLDMVKDLVEVTSLGDENFQVVYTVTVTNNGGVTAYDLKDTPLFDDDITITGASYTSDAPGNAGGALAGSGPWTLADDQFITTFGEHVYTITITVNRDLLTNNNDNGDNEYTPCAVPGNGPGSGPGQGLYNLAELDEDNDGQTDIEDDACGDLPNLEIVKDFVSATPNGDGTYTVLYDVFVTNSGGADGSYTLTDTPQFDDDITINSGSFSGQNAGALNTTGSTVLATAEDIAAGATHEYNLSFNVTLDLSEGSTDGGDNEYTACEVPGNGPGSNPGEGLYNLAELDTDNDGDTDLQDDACGDLPNITMVKDFGSATANGDGTYTVTYTVTVANNGGAAGEYTLTDTPLFDDDITINSGSFSGQNSGALTDGANTLATDEAIAAGATHTYNLSFNVTLDLSGDANDNDGGDNQYTACEEPGNGPGSNPGEGLYNLAELDSDGDGDTDIEDDACGDLPNLLLNKDLGTVTANGDGTYTVTYTVTVSNNGGADGSYTLTDTPLFDDDVTINSGSYSGQNAGAMNTSGSTTLATAEPIAAGATHTYNVSFNVTLDLTAGSNDGGDNVYTACEVPGNGPGSGPGQGLYNLAELDTDNDGDTDLQDDACGDLPNITMVKDFGSATLNADGSYTVTYTVTVGNDGGAAGIYNLFDTPQFDDDITINFGSFSGQNSGALTDGTNTLATNESIAAGATHTYNLSFNVTLDLSGDANDNDGGDNQYTACEEPGNGPGSNPGEGLYNLAELDSDGDGDIDIEDDACGDLPNITLDKILLGVTDNGDGTFTASYQILVSNNGGAEGTYSLDDVAEFDDDITIINGGFEIDRGGTPLAGSFIGDPSPLNLATNEAIAPGATHTYTIDYLAEIDLSEDSTDGGDNVYTPCEDPSGGDGSNPGEGLYNRAELDLNDDGTPDLEDDVCGDVPRADLSLIKVVDNETPDIGDLVTFTITVTNDGPSDATGVGVEDVVPNGYSNIGNISNGGTLAGNVINWDGISLVVGQSIDLTFTATVNAPGSAVDYVNIAEIDEADQIDEDSTPGNGADSSPGNGIGSEDPDGTQDPNDEDDGDDAAVMPPCMLTVEFEPTPCNDNGTPTNPNDDFFEIVATVTGINASGSWTAVDSRGNTFSGNYGEEFRFGPYNIFGNEGDEIVITITDSEDDACIASISALTPDDTCSEDCIITVTEPKTVHCFGDETNTPDDDFFVFAISVTGVNVGNDGWRAVDQFGNEYFGEYGISPNLIVNVGPYAWVDLAGETIVLTVTDLENPDCGLGTIELDVPEEPCSQDCSIQLDVEYVICDDNGTEWDPSDDVYYAWVNISGTNASFQGWITDDPGANPNTGFYGLYEFGPYPIAGGDHTLTIRDRVTDDCEATISIPAPPGTCSDGCRLDVFQQPPVCDDNGTPNDETDDVFFVTVTVQPLGQFGNGWRVVLGNGNFEPGGAYGEPVTLGPYPISEGPRTIEIADNQDISCRTNFNVTPPDPCSVPQPCSMTAGDFEQGPCLGNETPTDATDDFYILTYGAPNVTNPVGTQYELLLDGVVVATNDYGVGGSIPVPADGQTHTLTWRDAEDPTCATSATLPAVDECPEPCVIDFTSSFVYNDNGTPLDHSDDFYQLVITVTNGGANSGFWTISNGMGLNETHPYGVPVTISPIDANMDFSAIIEDSEDPNCMMMIRNPGQSVVGDFAWIDEDCDGVQDPGEAGLAGITVTLTGTDMNGNPVTATTVTDENGAYLFTNLPAGFNYKVTFSLPDGFEFAPADQGGDDALDSDAGDMGMSQTFMLMSSQSNLTIDAGYCELVCTIEPGDFTQGPCQFLENQSLYVLTFGEPTIENGCGEYEVLFNGVLVYSGTEGDGGSSIMVVADNQTATLTFRDACSDDCARSVILPAVEPCPPVVCEIDPGEVTTLEECNDNGTPNNADDDFYVVNFTEPTIQDGCADGTYEVLLDGTLVYTGTLGDGGSVLVVPADGNSHFVEFRDACNENCAEGVELEPVDPCSFPCVLDAELTAGPTCTDDGAFTVSFIVTGENSSIGWFATDTEGNVFNGFYNDEVTRTYTGLAAGTSVTITFIDLENGEECITTLSFDAPDCTPDPCVLTVVATPSECDDNGTTDDESDDTYTATVTVVGENAGSCFTYVIDGETFSGTYGEPFEVGPFLISGGNTIFTVTDCDDPDCNEQVLIMAPEPCSDGPELTVECPISNHFCPIIGEDIMLYRTDPFECTSDVVIGEPEVSGACNDGNFTFTVELIDETGAVLGTIAPGEPLLFEDVDLGDYTVRYTVTDDCGNTVTRDCIIRVADLDNPVAICVGSLNVQLGGWGLARLYPNSVDQGSYDNCAIESIELRRHIDRDQETCEDLDNTEFSEWGPYVEFTCCDASTFVTVEMRVTDVNGNINICWLDVLVEDKTLPFCVGLVDELVNCDELPENFDPNDTDQLTELFGTPEVVDNCSAEAVEQDPVIDLDSDGNGTITRSFIAIDAAGNESSTTFEQVITIFGCTGFSPGDDEIGTAGVQQSVSGAPVMLLQNYPNPANEQTVIPFVLPREGKATIEIFDALGSVVFRIEGDYVEGRNEVRVDVSRYNDGLYFYQLRFEEQYLNSKMIITKQ
ncbi:MAG: SdrD B-like domain-containing protein [Bacteroidota bacterium]